MNSLIIIYPNELDFIENRVHRIFEKDLNTDYEKIYSSSQNGDTRDKFIERVGKEKNILILINLRSGDKIAGFSNSNWGVRGEKIDNSAFLMNITKKKIYEMLEGEINLTSSKDSVFIFGNEKYYALKVFNNFLKKGGESNC